MRVISHIALFTWMFYDIALFYSASFFTWTWPLIELLELRRDCSIYCYLLLFRIDICLYN